MHLTTLSKFSSPDEILNQARYLYWGEKGAKIEEAVAKGRVPIGLRSIHIDYEDAVQRAVRMFVSPHIGQRMTLEEISAEKLAEELATDSQWAYLCREAQATKDKDGQIPSAHWIETQAPLYAEGKDIQVKWKDLKKEYLARHALHPVAAKAVALGVVNNQIATDHLTYVQPYDQIKVFVEYCRRSIASGKKDEHFLEQELCPYKKQELAKVNQNYDCSRFT